jgi:hypothetical protein
MGKRFWICGLVMFFAAMLLAFVVHALLLGADYDALGPLYRDAEDGRRHFPWMLLAHALIGFAMTWIFARGFSGPEASLAQGLRFGFAMALFSTIPGYLIHYAVQPLPPALVAKQVVFGTLSMLLLGALLAWLQPRRPILVLPD